MRAIRPKKAKNRRLPDELFYDVHLTPEKDWLPDELAHFRRIFARVDADQSGAIDQAELKELLVELGHPAAFDDDCVAELFQRTDKDGSGREARAVIVRARSSDEDARDSDLTHVV